MLTITRREFAVRLNTLFIEYTVESDRLFWTAHNTSYDPECIVESQNLKKAGLKVTLPRMKILEILEKSDPATHHLTAEDIYRALLDAGEDIGLATVYRVLTQFEAAGLVIRHHFEGGQAVFELDRGKHHHMVDLSSGKVIEFTSDEIERLQKEIADKHGYVIEERSMVLYVRPKPKQQDD